MRDTSRWFALAIGGVVLGATVVAVAAARRTSVTFDELYMVASGVRALRMGDLKMTPDHPPIMQYAYGAAASLTGVKLPAEAMVPAGETIPPDLKATTPLPRWGFYNRYYYAQDVFFASGNDPERLAFAARMVGICVASLLGLLVAWWAWIAAGPRAALFAATIVMFLPEVLAHAGIAYNDLPLAFAFAAALWSLQRAIALPTIPRLALATVITTAAVAVKFSAGAVVIAAIVLAIVHAVVRGPTPEWYKRVAIAVPLMVIASWLILVVIYRGDIALTTMRGGLRATAEHVSEGHGVAFFLGHLTTRGVWYFFPLALLFKTPVPLQALIVVGAAGYRAAWRDTRRRELLLTLGIGFAVFFAFLLSSGLAIGVRHAMPVWPMMALATAVGLDAIWTQARERTRVALGAVIVGYAVCTLAYYPWFLSYLTEWLPDRKTEGYRVMVDSNLDWGQGLLALRDWMRDQHADAVFLSYFGSARPTEYAIRYVRLASYFPLPPQAPVSPAPDWVVISATNLWPVYHERDNFQFFRGIKPDAVIGGSLYAYRLNRQAQPVRK